MVLREKCLNTMKFSTPLACLCYFCPFSDFSFVLRDFYLTVFSFSFDLTCLGSPSYNYLNLLIWVTSWLTSSMHEIWIKTALAALIIIRCGKPSTIFSHPFVLTLQKFVKTANLTHCWIGKRANCPHDVPELVEWPLSLEGWRHITRKDVGFSYSFFETTYQLLPKNVPQKSLLSLGISPAHQDFLTQIWALTYNLSLCIENVNGTGKTTGYFPLNVCNFTLLYDSTDHEFTPRWSLENYDVTSSKASLQWGDSQCNGTGNWEADGLPLTSSQWGIDQKSEWWRLKETYNNPNQPIRPQQNLTQIQLISAPSL